LYIQDCVVLLALYFRSFNHSKDHQSHYLRHQLLLHRSELDLEMTFLMEEKLETKVPTFLTNLTGKTIFLTGGSGFVGTALVWRLVIDSDIQHIYVLCRDGEE
jgi:FlaA1/EpsC-like NDP-sugar epimerase